MKCVTLQALLIYGVFFSPLGHANAGSDRCHPLLWPSTSQLLNQSIPKSNEIKTTLQTWSDKFLFEPACPVPRLSSAGRTKISDPVLMASREALEDGDKAAILALTYRLTGNRSYLHQARDILTGWATINNPTGHPIDETRLDGMIWAYDLLACDLQEQDKSQILNWFERMYVKKMAWEFGPITSFNNSPYAQNLAS